MMPRLVLSGMSRFPILLLATVMLMLCSTEMQGQTQTFTSSGTFVVPPGVTSITVHCIGGGGAGGTKSSPDGSTGGGGGGAYARKTLTVTPFSSYTVTVGAGGTRGTTGTNGGDSWFQSQTTVLAKGGSGVAQNVTNTRGTGGTAASSYGDVKYPGGDGAYGNYST
ncbi:MAG: hypothetical protein IH600_07010, partial [Bacteroidetes bacterium]|nr:hypothetical protein [Bacteroidota bacterium]